jgi:hypothetical protein
MSTYTTLGTGTWNDEELLRLVPDTGKPNKKEKKKRGHVRREITGIEYIVLKTSIESDAYAVVAEMIRTLATGEVDAGGEGVNERLEKIASDLERNGATDWTIVLCKDKSPRDGTRYYLEVLKES